MTARDTQRKRLYTAENVAFNRSFYVPPGAVVRSVRECHDYIERVQSRAYLRRKYDWHLTFPITVKDGRGYRRAVAYQGYREIQLPRWARTEDVMPHELAHLLTPTRLADHGPEFAAIYLDLVQHMLGKHEASRLRDQFRKNRVRVLTASGNARIQSAPRSRSAVLTGASA